MQKGLVLSVAALAMAATSFGQAKAGGGFPGSAFGGEVRAISAKQGEVIPVGDLRYRVLGVKSGQKEYTQRFDQRAQTQMPGFSTDQLVVVDLEVENIGEAGLDPAMFAFKLVDSDGGMSSGGAIDTRLRSMVVVQGVPRNAGAPGTEARAEIAPKGKRKLAVVFSIPRDTKPKGLQVYISQTTITQGGVHEWIGPLLATAALEKE